MPDVTIYRDGERVPRPDDGPNPERVMARGYAVREFMLTGNPIGLIVTGQSTPEIIAELREEDEAL